MSPVLVPRTDPLVSFAVLLLPAFNSLACNAFLDPLRAANYLHGSPLYRWDLLTPDGTGVMASNGMSVAANGVFAADERHDYTVVNASWTPERYRHRRLLQDLRQCARIGQGLIALDTGAFVLANAGLLDGHECVVHNEHEDAFVELFPHIRLRSELFVIDRDRWSCVGGFAAADLSLELLHRQHGLDLANAVARYVFKERLRPGSESSTSPSFEPIGHALPDELRDVILLMQRNLEEPLSLREVADYTRYSSRQLARLFKRFTGLTPVRYYLNLRLHRARGLVTQTERPIAEIAEASGFGSSERFSTCYRELFLISPGKDRIRGRVPFHFRSNPGLGSVPSSAP